MNKMPRDKAEEVPVERQARAVMRRARKASLGTLDEATRGPYVSLVTVATDMDCAPILLLSRLARHTTNLKVDDRASLLFDGTGTDGDPLEGGRVTVSGRLVPTDLDSDARRFIDRHPEAGGYASFADFSFYRMEVSGAHYVGGFGRIVTMKADQILLDPDQAHRFALAEASIIKRMNSDQTDMLGQWVSRTLDLPKGSWTIIACDPEGCDLACDDRILRLDFTVPLGTPTSAHSVVADIEREAERDS